MNTKYPCNTCSLKYNCWSWCYDILDFYGRFIKGYANAGTNSYMYKAVKKIIPYTAVRRICRAIDWFYNVGMHHPNSGDWVSFNRKGRVVDRGTKDDNPHDIFRDNK